MNLFILCMSILSHKSRGHLFIVRNSFYKHWIDYFINECHWYMKHGYISVQIFVTLVYNSGCVLSPHASRLQQQILSQVTVRSLNEEDAAVEPLVGASSPALASATSRGEAKRPLRLFPSHRATVTATSEGEKKPASWECLQIPAQGFGQRLSVITIATCLHWFLKNDCFCCKAEDLTTMVLKTSCCLYWKDIYIKKKIPKWCLKNHLCQAATFWAPALYLRGYFMLKVGVIFLLYFKVIYTY